jgi:hypothetical protein
MYKIVTLLVLALLPLTVSARPKLKVKSGNFIKARMAFKLSELPDNIVTYSFVNLSCYKNKCSWIETTVLQSGCIDEKNNDPYLSFPQQFAFSNEANDETIKVEGDEDSLHVVWKDGTGNFRFSFDCKARDVFGGCKVKSANGTITDSSATHTTRYEYIEPIKGKVTMKCPM